MSDVVTLSREGCQTRQALLCQRLRERSLDAALLLEPTHVHYFTGHWSRLVFRSALLIRADGESTLAIPFESGSDLCATNRVRFNATRHGTLIDRQDDEAVAALAKPLTDMRTIGCDRSLPMSIAPRYKSHDLLDDLLALRRHKHPDEIAILEHGVHGCEAAYRKAREVLAPGLTEIELFARLLSAAIQFVGEPVGEFGNDFRSGEGGGAPRNRKMQSGELLPLDLGLCVRGYTADLCRTFAIGGNPSSLQRDAHAAVISALKLAESLLAPGASCREIYERVHQSLDGFAGLSFPHHLGHGIGLCVHEAPRLNPNWNDTLAVGDVLTLEPGLYGKNLNGGVRIENDYLITGSGFRLLSPLSTDF